MHRDGRSSVAVIMQAALLLVAVAIGAHVVYGLLRPVLPSLLAIAIVMAVASLILRR